MLCVDEKKCSIESSTFHILRNENFGFLLTIFRHLREKHCTVEGGSFVCKYGYNCVCSSLPLDGVSDKDYEAHVEKYHLMSTMKEAEEKWNIFSAAQNLPAVLNDPSRGRQSNLFTKKWGDSFVETQKVQLTPHLQNVNWNQLELYCKKIGKRYRRHSRLGTIGNNHDYSAPTPGSISPSSSISSLQIIENSNFRNINEKFLNDATIRDIPQIFLKEDLDFSKQETFALVFHGLDINSDDDHQEMQEKLSHYLDIVEIQIAKQVSMTINFFNCFRFYCRRSFLRFHKNPRHSSMQ